MGTNKAVSHLTRLGKFSGNYCYRDIITVCYKAHPSHV